MTQNTHTQTLFLLVSVCRVTLSEYWRDILPLVSRSASFGGVFPSYIIVLIVVCCPDAQFTEETQSATLLLTSRAAFPSQLFADVMCHS